MVTFAMDTVHHRKNQIWIQQLGQICKGVSQIRPLFMRCTDRGRLRVRGFWRAAGLFRCPVRRAGDGARGSGRGRGARGSGRGRGRGGCAGRRASV